MEHFAVFKTVKISLNWNAHLIGTLWICREIIHLNGTPVYFFKEKNGIFLEFRKILVKKKCSKSKEIRVNALKNPFLFVCGALVASQKHTMSYMM